MALTLVFPQFWGSGRLQNFPTMLPGGHIEIFTLPSQSRKSFLADGMPRPAPLLSRTPAIAANSGNSLEFGSHSREVLQELGLEQRLVDDLITRGVVEHAQLKQMK